MVSRRLGKLGKLGKVNSTYTYARAREGYLACLSRKKKNLRLIAITFPSFPSFPQKKKRNGKTNGYGVGLWVCLLPIIRVLLP